MINLVDGLLDLNCRAGQGAGQESTKVYLTGSDKNTSYSFAEWSPTEHIKRIAEALENWASRIDVYLKIGWPAPVEKLQDFKYNLQSGIGAGGREAYRCSYKEAHVVSLVPPHSFGIGKIVLKHHLLHVLLIAFNASYSDVPYVSFVFVLACRR